VAPGPIDDDEYDTDYVPPLADHPVPYAAADYDAIDGDEVADLLADGPHPYLDPAADNATVHSDDEDKTVFGDGNDDDDSNQDVFGISEDDGNDGNDGYEGDIPNGDDDQDDFPAEDGVAERGGAQGAPNEAEDQGAPNEAEDQGVPNKAEDRGMLGEPADHGAPDGGAAQGATYNLRPRGGARNSFKMAIDAPHDTKSYFPPRQLLQQGFALTQRGFTPKTPLVFEKSIFGYVLNQMTAKAGIKTHGKAAEAALMNEFAQLEELDVYEPVDPRTLSKAQRMSALRAINLIKEKRDGTLKGRTVADGRPQRSLYDKSETASPTVATDALMLSIMIDAHENRDVATADVAGAYLKAYMDDYVIMKFTGDSVDILCKMNPRHLHFVTTENGVKVLYVRLVKAIYGCVKSALLWYDLFHGHLQQLGFELNPYDPCVANCVLKGKQCTIAWYVDDTKISHVDPEVVTSIIDQLEARFGKMTVTRGKEHAFLSMKIRYTGKGTAVVTMKQYLEEALAESGLNITHNAVTPALKTLFDVDSNSTPLSKAEAETFHSVSAKLLYVSLRARVDLLLAIAFLCTIVSKSTKQDQEKWKRVLDSIKGSIDDEYVLGADDLGRMRSRVDAAFAVHPDMKSHTGGVISFGTGGIACKSSKQKLVTKSSTDAETVGASDYLPNTLWVKIFLEAQGHTIQESFFEQDNESAIRLERNGRVSAGPNLATSTLDISGSKIGRRRPRSPYDTVRRSRCWPIFLPSHCKGSFSVNSRPYYLAMPTSTPSLRAP
jgi:hypothetical protein